MVISLGYCGPTDYCLKLSDGLGGEKEYSIESLAWQILSVIHEGRSLPFKIPLDERYGAAEFVWEFLNDDQRSK